MNRTLTVILTLAAVTCFCWLRSSLVDDSKPSDKSDYGITPEPTIEELARFRIVTNQFGTAALQMSGPVEKYGWKTNTWNLLANRFKPENVKGLKRDMGWWINAALRSKPEIWKPVTQPNY
jgi:hypothetical protein